MRRILCVTAHPDDEAANFGGSIARYSAAGVECHLVCLTAGESARNRGAATGAESLKALRRAELEASCRLLGFQPPQIWDLPDAALPQAPFYDIVGRLVATVRTLRPEVVLTMGPEGSATAHPDHAMAGICATAAFHWAAHARYFPEQHLEPFQPARLFYATAAVQPPRFPPVWLPHPDTSIDIAAYVETKIAAFHCHQTQAPLFERVEGFLRASGGRELFHLAAGRPFAEDRMGTDLFQDLL